MKINHKYIFFIFLSLALTYNKGIATSTYDLKSKTSKRNILGFKKIFYIDYLKNNIQLGYDSNILKISNSEDSNQPTSSYISLKQTAFVGNDFNDKEAMEIAGVTFCPADAHKSIKSISDHVLKTKGGDGVIRELLDLLKK